MRVFTLFALAVVGTCSLVATVSAAPTTRPFSPGTWERYGRGSVTENDGSLTIEGVTVVAGDPALKDYELKFRARAPESAAEAQIWCAVRVADRDRRYVVGLRGGNNQQLYVSRIAALGQDRFLGYRPLNFIVKPGEWYAIRVQIVGDTIAVYLRDDTAPFIVVKDVGNKEWPAPEFFAGRAALGGGYLAVEYRDVEITPLPADTRFPAPLSLAESAESKEKRRVAERAAYRPFTVKETKEQSISLNGDWLFLPDYSFAGNTDYAAVDLDDTGWHVMPVPNFWTPTLAWLYGEQASFNGPFMGDKGQSDNWWSGEERRCDGYTFDWRKTKAAWYRQHLTLPADLGGQRYELCFDAIAKHSELWINGTKVTDNLGMFRELRADVTKFLRPGANVIAVKALSRERAADTPKDPDTVVGVAITVEVTARMLGGIPEGMYRGLPAGIWQPVTLNVTSPTHIKDVFFKPRLDGASIDVDIENTSTTPQTLELSAALASAADKSPLEMSLKPATVQLAPGETKTITLETGTCAPKLWTPAEPNLYQLTLQLGQAGKIIDTRDLNVGFRTFTVSGKQFLLNGKPYWLRGANHTPMPLRPNDAALAEKFFTLMHENNIRITRSHVAPFTSTWLDAADRIGVGVSYEGIWPWLMLEGGLPAPGVLQDWREEWIGLIRKYRNHPSILLWTVNNEMHLDRTRDDELRKQKWQVLSDGIKLMREADPSRPVVADSGYTRTETMANYNGTIRPNNFDDGDVDDVHWYGGWYNPSFYIHYSFNDWGAGRLFKDGTRPLITQELSTGYPRTDDGHPTRFYKMTHLTPQATVGDASDESSDPAIFLNRVAQITKMLAESMRRSYHDDNRMAGALHFALLTWFKNTYDAKTIEPFAPIPALKKALSPVLVSAELYGWNYYAGAQIPLKVSLLNDAEHTSDLGATRLAWSIRADGKTLSSGSANFPPVSYYASAKQPVTILLPAELPSARVRAQLHFDVFAGDRLVTSNDYDLLLATRAWAGVDGKLPPLRLHDPEGVLTSILTAQRWSIPAAGDFASALKDTSKPLVIADFKWVADATLRAAYLRFIEAGGKALLYKPGKALLELDPERIASFRDKNADIITMHIPESPIVDGIETAELAWFTTGDERWPAAATGDFIFAKRTDSTLMVLQHVPLHAYLQPTERDTQTGSVLFSLPRGKGVTWVTQVAHECAPNDPVPGRILFNLLKHIGDGK